MKGIILAKKQTAEYKLQKETDLPQNRLEEKVLIDHGLGLEILKDLQKDLYRTKKNLAKCYKKSKEHRLTESEKIGLIWFLENYHNIEETYSLLEESFSPKSAAYLPILDKNTDKIRIIQIINRFIDENKRINSNNLINSFKKYQKNENLTLAELWFVPTALQILTLIELEKNLSLIFSPSKNVKTTKIDRKIKYLVLALLYIKRVNWKKFVESASAVEQILLKDPANIYGKMDFKTRDTYRHIVENIAKRSNKDEVTIANQTLSMAKGTKTNQPTHIGHFLAGNEEKALKKAVNHRPTVGERTIELVTKNQGKLLVGVMLFLSFIFSILILNLFENINLLLTFLPLWLIVLAAIDSLTNRILIRFFPPQPLFKLNYDGDIAKQSRTLVVISTLLTEDPKEPASLLENIELNYLSNKDSNIFFGLLLSFCESKEKEDKPTETQIKNLKLLEDGLKELNKKYPRKNDIFILMFRKRFWNESQKACIEWERKRGKIIELARLLRGNANTNFHLVTSDQATLKSIKYVVTLDHGETLAKDAVKKLIATISHPLNIPIFDKVSKTIQSGYGIIQPNMAGIVNENNSLFSKMLNPQGWDSYSGLSSNVYQDVFSEGVYFGKGIFNVDTFLEVIDNCFPENTILSHDLIEGFYCRTGCASDIQIFEEEPLNYFSYTQRKERWIRGDWQNIFWLFSMIKNWKGEKEKNPLLFFHKWRIFNNLLRSLVFPLSSLLSIYGWTALDSQSAFLLTIVVLVILNTESLLSLIDFLPPKHLIWAWSYYLKSLWELLSMIFLDVVFKTVFMFHLALLSTIAISKALFRIFISHKKTLEWQAFHLTIGSDKNSLFSIMSFMAPAQIIAIFLGGFYYLRGPQLLPSTIIALWIVAPFVAYLFSIRWQPKVKMIEQNDINRIRIIALKTWRFFDELISEKTNYLPPDHFLESGRGKISRMTSITNIGAYLLSAKAASDLGHITSTEFLTRQKETLNSIEELERTNGHFFNWYDIKTKKALSPRYISTVDSGNFAASLMTLREATLELLEEVVINEKAKEALNDYVIMMIRAHNEVSLSDKNAKELGKELEILQTFSLEMSYASPHQAIESLIKLQEKLNSVKKMWLSFKQTHKNNGFHYWLEKSEILINERVELLYKIYPWLNAKKLPANSLAIFKDIELETSLPSIRTEIEKKESEIDWSHFSKNEEIIIRGYLDITKNNIIEVGNIIDGTITSIDQFIETMDFSFLYDKEKELFRIGYNADKKRYDKNYYDLFASEARLASLFAIAKNDVSLDHWSRLGRPLAHYKGKLALLSWGGSIFEYFFPQMLLPTKKNTLLDIAQKTALWAQIKYAKENSIPWGISESSYFQKNRARDYLYKMHGIPILGIRHVSKKDLVVAPYATFLALEQGPQEAIDNIKKLQHLGAEGKFGLYESVDFTKKVDGELVKVYMAHHQAAIIISIVNYLKNRPFEKRFMKNPELKSLSYLLNENVTIRGKLKRVTGIREKAEPHFIIKPKNESGKDLYQEAPLMHLISNGRIKSFVSNRGSGFLEYEDIEIIPFKKDPILDNSGNHIYIKDARKDIIWSASYQPTMVEPESYDYRFAENYLKIKRLNFGITTSLEIFIHPNYNAEIRALTVINTSQQRRILDVCSFGEVSMFNHDEFRTHPNFQKLKIISKKDNDNAILFTKPVPRGANTPAFAHLVVSPNRSKHSVELATERSAFIGSGSLAIPEALSGKFFPGNEVGIDKIFAIKESITLLPTEKKTVFFISAYSGKKERLGQIVKKIDNYNALTLLLKANRPKTLEKNQSQNTLQKIISLLFYYEHHLYTINNKFQDVRNRIDIDWNKPTIIVELKQAFSQTFTTEALKYLSQLIAKDFKLNIIIITHEKDEYSQKTNGFVEKVIGSIENEANDTKLKLTEKITIINEASLEKETYEGLIMAADLYWEASKKSFDSFINNEFRKI